MNKKVGMTLGLMGVVLIIVAGSILYYKKGEEQKEQFEQGFMEYVTPTEIPVFSFGNEEEIKPTEEIQLEDINFGETATPTEAIIEPTGVAVVTVYPTPAVFVDPEDEIDRTICLPDIEYEFEDATFESAVGYTKMLAEYGIYCIPEKLTIGSDNVLIDFADVVSIVGEEYSLILLNALQQICAQAGLDYKSFEYIANGYKEKARNTDCYARFVGEDYAIDLGYRKKDHVVWCYVEGNDIVTDVSLLEAAAYNVPRVGYYADVTPRIMAISEKYRDSYLIANSLIIAMDAACIFAAEASIEDIQQIGTEEDMVTVWYMEQSNIGYEIYVDHNNACVFCVRRWDE